MKLFIVKLLIVLMPLIGVLSIILSIFAHNCGLDNICLAVAVVGNR